MLVVAALFALLALALIVAMVRLQQRHVEIVCEIHDSYRAERARLLDKITHPQVPMADGRPVPKVQQRRTPENARDYARVGTVARPRNGDTAEN